MPPPRPRPTATRCCSPRRTTPSARRSIRSCRTTPRRTSRRSRSWRKSPNCWSAIPARRSRTSAASSITPRNNPVKLNYSSAGIGTLPHVTMELLLRRLDIQVAHIPYKGAAPAMTDLLSGVVQLKMDTYATGNPHVVAGKLRALAYAAKARSPLMPNVPTVAEMGLPGYEGILWMGMIAPAGTPQAIVDRLAAAAAQGGALARPRRAAHQGRRRSGRQHAGGIQRADRPRTGAVARSGASRQYQARITPNSTGRTVACKSSPPPPTPTSGSRSSSRRPAPATPTSICSCRDIRTHRTAPTGPRTRRRRCFSSCRRRWGFRTGVIVSPGGYGKDYSMLADVLAKHPERFRGIALVKDDMRGFGVGAAHQARRAAACG